MEKKAEISKYMRKNNTHAHTHTFISTHTPAPASDTIITPALDPHPVPSVGEVMPRHAELIQSALSVSFSLLLYPSLPILLACLFTTSLNMISAL